MPISLPRYTIQDIYNLPDKTRVELIDREFYMMAPVKSIRLRLPFFYMQIIKLMSNRASV